MRDTGEGFGYQEGVICRVDNQRNSLPIKYLLNYSVLTIHRA